MSHLEIIERLCRMLDDAQNIIREQAALLEMHGISTQDGNLENQLVNCCSASKNLFRRGHGIHALYSM